MFCNFCGAQLQADQQFCGSCGRAVNAPPPAPAPMERVAVHARRWGIFWIALSAIHLLRGGGHLLGARVLRVVGLTWFDGTPWDWPMGHLVPAILSFVGLVSLILAVAGFAAGWGLLERRPWARTLAIAMAIFALLSPVLGTALGIYTLWVLMPAQSEEEWRRIARPA